jgi:hypothetical protein
MRSIENHSFVESNEPSRAGAPSAEASKREPFAFNLFLIFLGYVLGALSVGAMVSQMIASDDKVMSFLREENGRLRIDNAYLSSSKERLAEFMEEQHADEKRTWDDERETLYDMMNRQEYRIDQLDSRAEYAERKLRALGEKTFLEMKTFLESKE